MYEQKLTDRYGLIKMKVKLPIYDEYESITGIKNVTENLSYVKGGNSDTSRTIINCFTSLYDSYELDSSKTMVIYNQTLNDYLQEQAMEEYKITTPPNTTWKLYLITVNQLSKSFKRTIGYMAGDLTPAKAQIFYRLVLALVNLTTNTYTDTQLEATFKPYAGGG